MSAGRHDDEAAALETLRRLLIICRENPERGGLTETPLRVLRAWKFWTKGYDERPADILKAFEDGADGYDEMVVVSGLPVHSHCEHHMAPFWGEAHIGYIPDKRIVGLSKFGRLVDCFARRLQVQERLTVQIATAINNNLQPRGVGVILRCRHMCMESRGIQAAGTITVTSCLRGAFMTDNKVRDEFLALKTYSKGTI